MAEIKLQKRAVYAGDVHIALLKAGWSIADATKFVRELPAADVAPVVHGRWKYYRKQGIAVCTECSFERNLDENFGRAMACPNCGARMDLGGADNGT